jgi:serine/threonine-protein kinase
MSSDSSHRICELLRQWNLAGPLDWDTLRTSLANLGELDEPAVLAQMVEAAVLTSFQAEQVQAGRVGELVLAERYRLLEQVGAGGMGAVYRALDLQLARVVAVKVLPEQSLNDADAVARFAREARALAQVEHPNVVGMHGAGEDRGRPFLVMEYVEGVSLSRLLKEHGALAPGRAADYAHQAALGLHHAHERKLVHRDLKPGNLLITPEHVVKILDLGLARFLQDQIGDATITRDGSALGTPDYMAPEQFRDARRADPRSDVYALGCTLYHMLSGRVPFPGSSLSEKCRAHEQDEPPALEELAPDVPVGLALVVRRMMAKRPQDRFQSAREVAEALLPHVAGSARSVVQFRKGAVWEGGQLALQPRRGRLRLLRWATAGAAAGVVAALALLIGPQLFPRQTAPTPPPDAGQGAAKAGPPKSRVLTIPNGLTVAQDGTGQYRTIGEALRLARPGMTIRVLDAATYPEQIFLTRTQHRGITLEAVRKARLAMPPGGKRLFHLMNVPGVCVRGFALTAPAGKNGLIVVEGHAPGTLLEQLELQLDHNEESVGVSLEDLQLKKGEVPVVIRRCRFRGGYAAIQAFGKQPVASILIRDNDFQASALGVAMSGSVRRVCVAGNTFHGLRASALQIEHLMSDSEDLLLANNTMLACGAALRLWDTGVRGKNVQVCNNLVLGAAELDMLALDSRGGKATNVPGIGSTVLKQWEFAHNWREVKEPPPDHPLAKGWIPAGEKDVRRARIALLSRDPGHADFLRFPKSSPLASRGAGGDLPPYIGALPPRGSAAWDWQWTWDARVNKLLTVSREAKGGGRFRTISAAVKAAGPDTTVRVLDNAVYPELVQIDDPTRHAGLTLEAPKGATLLMTEAYILPFLIKDVPRVRVRGLHFREKGARADNDASFVKAWGKCPGLVLEDLDIFSQGPGHGISLIGLAVPPGEPPAIVRRCTVRLGEKGDGIDVIGFDEGHAWAGRSRGIRIEDNRILGGNRGILLRRRLGDVHVTGNLVSNCLLTAIEFFDLSGDSRGLLLANNTLFGPNPGFRIWENLPLEKYAAGQVEWCNNLLLGALYNDIGFLVSEDGNTGKWVGARGRELAGLWRFHHNCRELSSASAAKEFPLQADDWKLDPGELLSRQLGSADSLRPAAGSHLARNGAGTVDPSLPLYVGAVPPAGVAAWNWQHTWDARTGKGGK